MKNRSNRLPISDQLDDWVDGSWTVDCVCGVTFDDGEEMVNCDECGVWVHTRCSRYVKSEKLFACDKCKNKRSRNNSEETEVAQLLVELPTKTLGMQNPNQCFGREPLRRPFRLWTDIPMEDRVHVQGVPGGDTALFGGVSSVFSPELWKCTGHVPKKFNFQYREFPCWDEKKDDDKEMEILAELDDVNPASEGAGVLFSLSKENGFSNSPAPTATYFKRQVGEKKMERENGVKKDKIHSGKRKKDDNRSSKDHIGKKKARNADKDGELKRKGMHTSKPVGPTTMSSDAKLKEDRGSKIVKPGNSVVIADDSLSDSYLLVEKAEEEKKLAFSDDVSRHNFSSEAKEENAKTDGDDVASLLLDHNHTHNDSVKEEVVGEDRKKQNNNKESSGRVEDEKKIQDSAQEEKKGQVSNGELSHQVAESSKINSPHISADNLSENAKVIDSGIDCSKSNSELNVQVTDKNTVVSHCQTDESQRKMVKPSTKSKKENNSNNNNPSNDKVKLASKDEQRKSSSRINPHSVLKRSSSQVSQPAVEPSESAGSLQAETTAQKGGKMNQHSSTQPPMHPPPAPLISQANLSDEELALLLHQELNSSPRVPRVPRMRNSAAVPQLGSPTSTSTLMKRTSKDHPLVLRRKNKDIFKDGTRKSPEVENETKKVDKRKSSSDRSKHDATDDPLEAVENVKGSQSVSKSIAIKSPPPPSTTTASSGGRSSSAEGNDQNMSSTRSSLNASDDDTNGTVRRTTARTLPALIADIMSKGKRMTYEALCNAVLPHWPNLRKHNGERYAYSSHLQAVLDCLRNRSEWARLVDRGPKTNAGRKRRKPDAEHSEDNEVENTKSSEQYPKQKRNRQVRKRRRLAKQETSNTSKDPRRRHKAKVVSDDEDDDVDENEEVDDDMEDDVESFSNFTAAVNSTNNACSEDEEGSREASDSSDETENTI